MTTSVLDNPVWAALNGPHARFAEVNGRAARYQADVCAFAALADPADPAAWRDLAELAGTPGTEVFVAGPVTLPPGWETVFALSGRRFTDDLVDAAPDPEAVELGPADVPEMLDLVARTDPGPFRKRAVEMGTYLGIRRDGRLVAMAGERVRPPGWTEVTAVCTDPAHRGAGLAGRLVRAVVAGIRARGDRAYLHTTAENTAAIRVYERIGFVRAATTCFGGYRTPA